MSSVQQILSYVKRKYPKATQETDANMILDLDDIHKMVYVKIQRLKNAVEPYDMGTTIADQATYTLPSDCDPDNIFNIRVSQSATIDSSTEWDTFEYAGKNEDVTSGNWWNAPGNGTVTLVQDDLPISTEGLSIRLEYFPKPASLSATTDTPELDDYYHPLLKYGLIVEMANQGDNPDADIADYWQAKYDEFMQEVIENLTTKFNTTPAGSTQIEEWW